MRCEKIEAADVFERLKKGNEKYVNSGAFSGDVSEGVRADTAANGQKPFAVVIACSDSRVIPEAIFSCGIGELFVIRVAGNVVGDNELGSVEYAVEHLGINFVLVLGHTHCGAVNGAIGGCFDGYTGALTKDIARAIGDEKDDLKASAVNARAQAEKLRKAFDGVTIVSAVYDVKSGKVSRL